MKDLKTVMNNMQSNMQQTNLVNQQNELVKKQVSENAKSVIDDLFNELKSCYPAWKQAFDNREAWSASKKTWTKAFIENNISNKYQVDIGMAAARKGDNPFWPSVGQFINWCDGPEIDTDDAFNRMIDKKPCNGVAEFTTRQEVGFRCKQQLSEDKARALFKKVLTRNIQRVKNGELIEPEIIAKRVEAPEEFRSRETPEQRNIRIDAEIEAMQKNGTRLIGPYKKRYLETKGG